MAQIDKDSIDKIFQQWFTLDSGGSYEISNDGKVNVHGSCFMLPATQRPKGTKIPIKFGHVSKSFDISGQGLTSLLNSPDTVGSAVLANDNRFSNLQGLPKTMPFDGPDPEFSTYDLSNCGLTNLNGMHWAQHIDVKNNPNLTSLQGIPDDNFCAIDATGCGLRSLHGCPSKCRSLEIGSQSSPISTLDGIPPRLQHLTIDDNAPMLKLLEVLWGNKEDRSSPQAFEAALTRTPLNRRVINIKGDPQKVANITNLLIELYGHRHDAIPTFAFDLIKLGYRENAHF